MNDENRKAMFAKKNGSAIILVGVSGSGKSTLAKKQYPNAVICSTDKFIEDMAEKQGISYQEMMKQIQEQKKFGEITGKFYNEINDSIKKGDDVIIDRTNLTKGGRTALLEKLKTMYSENKKTMNPVAICMNLPPEEVNKRLKKREQETGKTIPPEVIEGQMSKLEIPTKDEGFAEIKVIEE